MHLSQYVRGQEGIDIIVGENVLKHIRRLDGVEIDSDCDGKGYEEKIRYE